MSPRSIPNVYARSITILSSIYGPPLTEPGNCKYYAMNRTGYDQPQRPKTSHLGNICCWKMKILPTIVSRLLSRFQPCFPSRARLKPYMLLNIHDSQWISLCDPLSAPPTIKNSWVSEYSSAKDWEEINVEAVVGHCLSISLKKNLSTPPWVQLVP